MMFDPRAILVRIVQLVQEPLAWVVGIILLGIYYFFPNFSHWALIFIIGFIIYIYVGIERAKHPFN